jgi:flavin reductase (DIM6/NTAB) family NADH-FMN oxidoreductase RutF
MRIDASDLEDHRLYRLLIDCVVPRPVAWASTLSADGRRNLAPFSFFNAVGSDPPTIVVSCGRHDDGAWKDTAENVLETGELVVNIASEDLAEQLIASSGNHPHGVDEWPIAGVTPAPCEHVAPPRVAEAPVALECRVLQTIALGEPPGNDLLIIAEVLAFHVRDGLYDGRRLDPAKLRPLCRLGGTGYAKLGEIFHRERPSVTRS